MNPLTFATQEWLDHFRGRLVDSAEFGAVTSHWEDDAKYVIEAEPEIGFPESIAYYMKWQGGKLVQAESRPAVTTGEAKFNVSAPGWNRYRGHRSMVPPARSARHGACATIVAARNELRDASMSEVVPRRAMRFAGFE